MRRLLQSKLGVSLLCVGAALCCAANFVKWPARSRPMAAAARAGAVTTEEAGFAPPALPRVLKCAAALSDWRALWPEAELRRDPLQYADLEEAPKPANSTPGVDGIPSAREALTLQAISLNDGNALAVINRRVVGVGDWVGDYQVVALTSRSVEVTSRWGRATVEMAGRGKAPKAALGTPPSADPPSGAAGGTSRFPAR